MSYERWKIINDYCSKWRDLSNYEVSDHGNVRHRKSKRIRKLIKERRSGYLCVPLADKDGHEADRYVHCLVANVFVGKRPKGKEVNHCDLVKTNNHYTNLEYKTRRQNIHHAMSHGRMPSGDKHGMAKLTNKEVSQIKKLYHTGKYLQKTLARIFDCTPGNISYILNGKSRVLH